MDIKYGRIGRCGCCDSQDVPVYEFPPVPFTRETEPRDLCRLCAATPTSTEATYERPDTTDRVTVMKTICFVGNEILKAIKEK